MKPKSLAQWFREFRRHGVSRASRMSDKTVETSDQITENFFQRIDLGEAAPVVARLQDMHFFTKEGYLVQGHRADWAGVDDRIAVFAARLIEALRRKGMPFYVHCALRSKMAQDDVFAKGFSKVRWPKGKHNQGFAVDIVHSHFHWELSRGEWNMVGRLGKNVARAMGLKVAWGGDWSFWDPAHWQLSDSGPPVPLQDIGRRTPRWILRHVSL